MKFLFCIKFLISHSREYILIFLTATIFFFLISTKIQAEENVFVVNDVTVEGSIDLNFKREKYINTVFKKSFEILMSKILLSKDLNKLQNLKVKEIKKLISSFQIVEETYKNNKYNGKYKIFYNDKKVKEFLGKKNISFSQPDNVTVVFFPLLIVNNEVKSFNENYFYNKWNEIEISNELIKFILPIDDLEDIRKISKMKNKIEDLNIISLVGKYDVKNYVFAIIDYKNKNLDIHLKTKFNNSKVSKNFNYKINNFNDEKKLNLILKNLKLKITDMWKEENLINILMPLSIRLKLNHKDLKDLDNARSVFNKIGIIDSHNLEEFNINDSFFKIYYFGNPKKLRIELLKFGYNLKNNQGVWQIYLNE
jgi:hypothetical protein